MWARNSTSQNQGRIIIEAMSDQENSVGLEIPAYHFSVVGHQKEDYQRLLFSRLGKYE